MAARVDGSIDDVLDAGAGSGVSTTVLDSRARRVVALDLSGEMLRANGASERVQGDFDALPFRDATFDGVAYTASLFLVRDPTVALREARRVLRPGGVVGAVAPLGWFTEDGKPLFDALSRESRSPTAAADVTEAVAAAFEADAGTWTFPTTAETVQQFHEIPAMAARLYPRADPATRVRKARELLDSLEGTFEQRWQWMVGTATGSCSDSRRQNSRFERI